MTPPLRVKTMMLHVGEISEMRAAELSAALAALSGVSEATVIGAEGVAYLKVSMAQWDQAGALQLINKGN